MKLSKIILENRKYVVREQLDLSESDIKKLSKAISNKLQEYLDIDNKIFLDQTVNAAINDLLLNEDN